MFAAAAAVNAGAAEAPTPLPPPPPLWLPPMVLLRTVSVPLLRMAPPSPPLPRSERRRRRPGLVAADGAAC
jgi:hypothetical protein